MTVLDKFANIDNAIQNNDVQKLSHIFDTFQILKDQLYKKYYIQIACELGKLDILKFLHEEGHCKLDYYCVLNAVDNGHYLCLKYLINKNSPLPRFYGIHDIYDNPDKFSISTFLCIRLLQKENVPIFYAKDVKSEIMFNSMKRAYHTIQKYILIRKSKKQTSVYEKDLIETSWHPSRFINWCHDEVEEQELKELFF